MSQDLENKPHQPHSTIPCCFMIKFLRCQPLKLGDTSCNKYCTGNSWPFTWNVGLFSQLWQANHLCSTLVYLLGSRGSRFLESILGYQVRYGDCRWLSETTCPKTFLKVCNWHHPWHIWIHHAHVFAQT